MKNIRLLASLIAIALIFSIFSGSAFAIGSKPQPNFEASLLSSDRSEELYAILTFIEGYDTEEEWQEHYDYLLPYVTLALSIINDGDYNAAYSGLAAKISAFDSMVAFFSNKAFEKHLYMLKIYADTCDKSEYFFERYGAALSIIKYVDDNNLDKTKSEIRLYLEKANGCLSGLAEDTAAYNEILRANTEEFLEICNRLRISKTYNSVYELYQKAIKYINHIDVSRDGIPEALELLSEKETFLTEASAYAEEFAYYAMLASASEGEARLGYIIIATSYLGALDKTAPGALVGIGELNAATIEYDTNSGEINNEVELTYALALGLANN